MNLNQYQVFIDNRQEIFRFPNGYGASVINDVVPGLLELAVIEFDGPDSWDFLIAYNTPITDDVMLLDLDQAHQVLQQIFNLDNLKEAA